ncbi:MAG: transposase [bacterium]|nr:transposase [bacterium]
MRKDPLVSGEVYHLMNKSIAGYRIFNTPAEFDYMLKALRYFSLLDPPNKMSLFMKKDERVLADGFEQVVGDLARIEGRGVQIISYSIMPTHFHILAKQLDNGNISSFMNKILITYTRYFNIKHERKGPLWVGRFNNVLVKTDEQLLHVTRYIHLNSVTAGLCEKAEQWPYSSYSEYVGREKVKYPMTNYDGLVDMTGEEYRQFCEDRAGYQRELAIIKRQAIE